MTTEAPASTTVLGCLRSLMETLDERAVDRYRVWNHLTALQDLREELYESAPGIGPGQDLRRLYPVLLNTLLGLNALQVACTYADTRAVERDYQPHRALTEALVMTRRLTAWALAEAILWHGGSQ